MPNRCLAEIFRLRSEARAALYQCGELDLHPAVDVPQADAMATRLLDELGEDAVQAIMADAFRARRTP